MGSYSQITLGGYPTFSLKNNYSESVVNLLFQTEDFVTEKRKNKTRNKLVWGDAYSDDNGNYTFRGFIQTVKNCRERLEIYGHNLKQSKKDFLRAKKLKDIESFYDFPITKVSFEEYLQEVRYIIKNGIVNYKDYNDNFRDALAYQELLIEGQTISYGLYAIFSTLDDEEIVEYNLSDVIHGGWVTGDVKNAVMIETIIILTEGKTDSEFISKSLQLLFPHLYPYYHFIDFEGYKVEGGASALVKLVRSFAASNVKHPIIVLFDNDTAGISELSKLISLPLPSNIKLLKLPNITLAKKYPTIGPSGKKIMNINGLAAGIELYLGQSILRKDNSLIPVRWRDFNDSLKKYQGVIENKDYIHQQFRQKIKIKDTIGMEDMKTLLSNIFAAFR